MRGTITARHVFMHSFTIVRHFGPTAYLRCLAAVLSGRPTTFLECVCADVARR